MAFGQELKMQLYFRDDNAFTFRKLPVQYSCLAEKAGDALKRAWKHFYCCQIPFPGYGNMKSGQVSLGFARDIILDPFNMVPMSENSGGKPSKAGMKDWIANIAENQRHIFRSKREMTVWTSRITWAELGVLFIMVIVWAIVFVSNNYGPKVQAPAQGLFPFILWFWRMKWTKKS